MYIYVYIYIYISFFVHINIFISDIYCIYCNQLIFFFICIKYIWVNGLSSQDQYVSIESRNNNNDNYNSNNDNNNNNSSTDYNSTHLNIHIIESMGNLNTQCLDSSYSQFYECLCHKPLSELYPDRCQTLQIKLISYEPRQQITLAHTTVSNKHHWKRQEFYGQRNKIITKTRLYNLIPLNPTFI